MSLSLFILTLSLYLVSIVAGLISAFFVKLIPSRFINTLIIFHILLFMFWLVIKDKSDSVSNPGISNYLFLSFFCSGVFTAGLLLRSRYPVFMKIYYACYLISIFIFLVAPSRVLGFIASGNIYSINPTRFHISENYYFIEQQSNPEMPDDLSGAKFYKIVREMGMFHKTLSRDVALPPNTDSVNLLNKNLMELIQVRVYYLKDAIRDSIDLEIPVGNHYLNSKEIKQIRN